MEKVFKIINKSGLHARAAGMFVREASKYSSQIEVIYNDRVVNAKSIMGIMSLGLSEGEIIKVVAEGIDDKEAIFGLERLLNSKFNE